MAVKTKKVRLVAVPHDQEVGYLHDKVMEMLAPVVELLDNIGINYTHETPWEDSFFHDPKFYVFRIRVDAVGRINTCKDAVLLGLLYAKSSIDVGCWAFTSGALFRVYQLTKLVRRSFVTQKGLEKWLNEFITDAHGQNNARYLNLLGMDNPEYE